MIQKLQNRLNQARKNKKGFTLVELIVVLVILAILAAILIPTFSGYIDRAKQKSVQAEARTLLMAAETISAEDYAEDSTTADIDEDEVRELAGVDGGTFAVTVSGGKVDTLAYDDSAYFADYDEDGDPQWTSGNIADRQ